MSLQDLLYYETEARRAGYLSIAGTDEAGRGPLAGPVVAAAVIPRQVVTVGKSLIKFSGKRFHLSLPEMLSGDK